MGFDGAKRSESSHSPLAFRAAALPSCYLNYVKMQIPPTAARPGQACPAPSCPRAFSLLRRTAGGRDGGALLLCSLLLFPKGRNFLGVICTRRRVGSSRALAVLEAG